VNLAGPLKLEALADERSLKVLKKYRFTPNLARQSLLDKREAGKCACGLANVPFDRMQSGAAIGDVGCSNVLASRDQVLHPNGEQGAERNLEG
jgi:hypothetical protein